MMVEISLYLFHMCVGALSHVQLFESLLTVACGIYSEGDFPGKNTGAGCHFSRVSSLTRDQIQVSAHIIGRFFTV